MPTRTFSLPAEFARHIYDPTAEGVLGAVSRAYSWNDPSFLAALQSQMSEADVSRMYDDFYKVGNFATRTGGAAPSSFSAVRPDSQLTVFQEDDASIAEQALGVATPLAMTAGVGMGLNALAGAAGLTNLSAAAGGAGSGLADAIALEEALASYTPDWLAGGASAGASGAGAVGADYLASIDAADAVLGQDMLNLAGTQGVDLGPLWNSNVFGAAGGAAAASGLGGVLKGLGSGFKDLLGGVKSLLPSGGAFDTALATAPVLAAINYAKNQSPFDVSRLEDTYNQFDPSALAYEFDQNTARGRDALTSSLTNRGVMGSSFGNMDLTNFQTSRDLGRRSLVNQGLAQRGNIAASILDAKVKERGLKNDLYGRSLLALGDIFGGRNQPGYQV